MPTNCCRRCLKGLSRRMPCFVAWTLLLVLSAIYFIFICPSITRDLCIYIPLIQGLIFSIVINNLILATFTDPGRYSRAPNDENDDSETTFHKTGSFFISFSFSFSSLHFTPVDRRDFHCFVFENRSS